MWQFYIECDIITFVNTGKQVKILYEPVAVRCKNVLLALYTA